MQQYVKQQLNGLTLPNPTQNYTLTAQVQPPPIEPATGPRAYIWASKMQFQRQSMPRGPGFLELTWPIDIWLTFLNSNQDPNVEQTYALMVDAVLNKLWTTTMPLFITDPTTGQESQILSIGEMGEIENPPAQTIENLRMLMFGSGLYMTVKEIVQR